jgi:hypothetical protein
MTIDDAIEKHAQHLMSIPGVVGVGVGERDGRPVVLVMTDRPAQELEGSGLPSRLEGFPVQLDPVGEISAF